MAVSADGSVSISVGLDSKPTETGIKRLNGIFKNFGKQVAEAYNAGDDAASRFNDNLFKIKESIFKQESELQKLKAQFDAIKNGEITPKELQELGRQIKTAKKDVDELDAAFTAAVDKCDELDFGLETDELIKAREETNTLSEKLAVAHAKLNALTSKADKIKLDPGVSDEAQELARKIDFAGKKLDYLKVKEQEAEKAGADMGAKAKQAAAIGQNAFKSMGNSVQQTFKRIKNLVASAFVFSVIYKGLDTVKKRLGAMLDTNQQFQSSLMQVKSALKTAFQPIYEYILPAITKLMAFLARALTRIAAFTSALFGKTLSQSAASAKAIDEQAEALNNTSEAAEDATGNLAAFDTINTLSDKAKSSDKGKDKSNSFQMPTVDVSKTEKALESLKAKVKSFAVKMKTAFQPSISAWSQAFNSLKEPAGKMFSSVKKSATDLYSNTLKPFAEKITTQTIPNCANKFSETFAPIFQQVMPVLMNEFAKDFDFMCQQVARIVDDVFTPAIELMEKIFCGMMDGIKSAWDTYGESILEKFVAFRDSLKALWDTIYTNILKPVFDYLFEAVNSLWDNHLKPLWDNLCNFFGSVINFILTLWNNVLSPVVNFVVETVGPIIVSVVKTVIDIFGTVFGAISDVIGGILKALGGLLDFLTGVFSGDWNTAWEGIKKFFKGIWDAIWGIVKGVVNLIIDGLNFLWRMLYGALALVINGVGSIVKGIGSLLGQEWGWSIPTDPPVIPKLARGAVIPPNREFLAVLGDQKSGTNIEAPLDTLFSAFKAANADSGQNVTIPIYLDGEKIYQNQNRIKARKGVKLSMGAGW